MSVDVGRPEPGPGRGFVCVALAVFLSAGLACDSGSPRRATPGRQPPRLLVVGWDGATFQMLDPLIAAGRLPHLAALMDRGSSARLESTIVPISSAAWSAIVTGKGPGRTGVYSFFELIPGSYDVRLITSQSNRAAPIWRLLTRKGIGTNVVGVRVTYPPEPILGKMVAGMLSPVDADYAYTPELTAELRAAGFVPDLGIWREERDLTWERVEEQLDIKEEILRGMLGG